MLFRAIDDFPDLGVEMVSRKCPILDQSMEGTTLTALTPIVDHEQVRTDR